MTKIQKLIGTLVVLVAFSLSLWIWDGKGVQGSFDRSIFVIEDTAAISAIHIQSKVQDISVQRDGQRWTLNDSMAIDPSLIQISESVLSQVSVLRPISQLNIDEVRKQLLESGQKITITMDGHDRVFYAGGNLQKTQSYFGDADLQNVYLVGIPGYSNYVSGIFELTANQWRDRLLFNSNFRSLQSLQIAYADGSDLEIRFKDRFFTVDQIQKIDTAVLTSYINSLEGFQLNDYLKAGEFPRYDSLLKTEPLAHLSIRDIDLDKNRELDVYPKIAGERFYLLSDRKGDMIVVDQNRIQKLLVTPDQFEYKLNL
ncbi:DUF4340 domain-containing protein [Reichenbachiella agarivorans]|uniref:DUF4340 domain-containing protein n=1 Tax=Reichenbachiella agarivorans TaxID=2979464 RepID=A0ABY6CPS8_9BACT|nr:DUF4340 domain-containing protein [Reichenbachiella agarivorans]UXP32523.1 DUF4340 domain-containing protein [Reichenbachiella agarivorans]